MPSDRQRKARLAAIEASYLRSQGAVPGAAWSDVPLERCHLPGIPYSYYDDEIVMIRERTAALIERQKAQAAAQLRAQQPPPVEEWSHIDGAWKGVSDE